jgi:hypothetical protein
MNPHIESSDPVTPDWGRERLDCFRCDIALIRSMLTEVADLQTKFRQLRDCSAMRRRG